ncbi:MAG: nuclear transport factor 2 family protein [Deltaproteobacteria bacterium]|jgi:hypothetical protein|nr:nuclear transport factor 2 family protein [Deltaproteobacteria bacterium]
MKKILLVLALICLVAGPAFAASADEAAVDKAVDGMIQAMLSGKRADLEQIPMKSLVYVHSAGAVDDCAVWVDKIADGKVDNYQKIEFKDQTINVDGDVAVVRHIFEGTIITKGQNHDHPYNVRLGVMQIWRKDGGAWKLFARQAFRLPTP